MELGGHISNRCTIHRKNLLVADGEIRRNITHGSPLTNTTLRNSFVSTPTSSTTVLQMQKL